MAYSSLHRSDSDGKYCMYLRKSRADLEAEAHGEGETLLRHEIALYDLARKLNIHILKENIYREIVSGESIEARPEMQRLLKDVEQGRWTGVLVMEVERLARGDTSDQGTVAKTFKYSSTKIITPSKTYDPDNEFDEEYFEFSLFMSRREYKTINRRIQRGRIASAKEGKFLSSVAPYGYKKVKIRSDKGYMLEQVPDRAAIVKMIYEWYVIGDLQEDGSYTKIGATRIAAKLNNMGIKTASESKWTKPSITDILKNPVYIGKIRWSYKKEMKNYDSGQLKKLRTKASGEYILVDGLHTAIIDRVTYDKAQQLMSDRGHIPVPGNGVMKNPLAALVYCGKCGRMMTRLAKNKKTPYDILKCVNAKCTNVSSPLYLVEDVLLQTLRSWLINYKTKWDAGKLDSPYDTVIRNKEIIIGQLRSSLGKLLDQKERIHTLLEQGVYSTDTFLLRNKKIIQEIAELENTLKEHETALSTLRNQAEYTDIFLPKAQFILDTYHELDSAAVRNEALKEILEKVIYIKSEPNKKGNRNNKNFEIELYPRVNKF
jgi:DNA invertase Pin-like site-specific DNA recombinase